MQKTIFFLLLLLLCGRGNAQYKVIAYYSGDSATIDKYNLQKITHLIYGFGHVKDGNFVVNEKSDAALVALKNIRQKYPRLKTMIALGGWGGCEFCSQTFNDPTLTKKFAVSVKDLLNKYQLDGIDLDWEYPAIPGHPGHQYIPEDKENFTRLVKELRTTLGNQKLVTFAAGGFQSYLEKSVDWKALEPYVDFVNMMTYDLVHGYSTVTGHHTPVYSSKPGEESLDNVVKYFKQINFPLQKVIAGAAFYSREFAKAENINNGLYQSAEFLNFTDYKHAVNAHTKEKGFIYHWDEKTKSPYWYNAEKKIFVTGEDRKSLQYKCDYVKQQKLGGIMFWELNCDTFTDGLLNAIHLN